MADFKTHLAASTLLGVGYGGAAYGIYQVPLPHCVLAAGLCSVSGMLPDIDSGPGRPLREITTFMASVVPVMLFGRLQSCNLSNEMIILAGAGIYVLIRFLLGWLLKNYTVHRGMFHSLPAAAIFGELAFLLAYGDDTMVRWFIAGGVVVGYLSHLLLDEVYSVQWNGLPRLKKSFGTALKIFGDGWWPNLSAYAKLAVLTFLVLEEPGFMKNVRDGQMNRMMQDLAQGLPERWPTAVPGVGGTKIVPTKPASQQIADPPGGFESPETISIVVPPPPDVQARPARETAKGVDGRLRR